MNIEEIENKIAALDETVKKLKELVADAKVCNSDITKTLIASAIKKYATVFKSFKLEESHEEAN